MVTQNKKRIETLVGTAVLSALVVVFQVFAAGVKVGPVSFTFSLVPIVLGAILYGPLSGAFLGGVFGLVVTIATVTGADVGAYMMFEKLPVLTVVLCMVKGIAAGLVSGLICRAFVKHNHPLPGLFVAAIACPVVNTGIFCIGLLTFYRDVATLWMGGTTYSNLIVYTLLGIVGVNFLVELVVNVILAPGIERVIYAVRKRH
ncbi:MAG: ECF transporter S component [Ruminococcaceae bacterium]|nr:ECF transporter S component [Oscillospiraceae bacterium]